MPQDALQSLLQTAPIMVAKAVDNLNLCQFFMGILGRTVWEAHQRGHDIFKVSIAEPMIAGHQLRAKMTFDSGATPDLNFFERVDGMKEFVGKKSEYMAKVLEKNPTYSKFLQKAVEKLEVYAARRGFQFSDIEIRHGFISTDDYIVLEMVQ